jgi:hypothetical protein
MMSPPMAHVMNGECPSRPDLYGADGLDFLDKSRRRDRLDADAWSLSRLVARRTAAS